MGELVIRGVEDETVERIARLAREHGRSLEGETLTLIRKALGSETSGRDRAAVARRIAAMAPTGQRHTDTVLLLRQDRDR